MFSVYKKSVDEISNEQFESELSRQSKNRIKSFDGKSNFEIKRIVTSFLLIRQAVSEFCGIEDYELKYRKYKPFLPFCNLSCSRFGKYVAVAISDKKIGIDMERIESIKKRSRYFMLTDEENYYVNRLSDGVSNRYWEIYSKKYAYSKMKGYSEGDIADFNVLKINDAVFSCEKFGSYIVTVCESTK